MAATATPRLFSTSLRLCLSLLLLFSATIVSISSAQCDPNEKTTLLRIKRSFKNSEQLASWSPSTDCCRWSGVDCYPNSGYISDLAIFNDTKLSGTIPPAVGNLTHLSSLILYVLPNLVGPISPEIAHLTNLTFLRLESTAVSGPVPSFLSSLRKLDFISLAYNRLSGTIPPSLGSLSLLTALWIDGNHLSGRIPQSFGKFQQGFSLRLTGNKLTGHVPTSFGKVIFQELDLSDNQLSGDASFLFGSESKNATMSISISRNKFKFDLTNVKFPIFLYTLDLSHNEIFGEIPQQIAKLPLLQYLNLSYNRLCGPIPVGDPSSNSDQLANFNQSSYGNNLCLCGTPLPPCK